MTGLFVFKLCNGIKFQKTRRTDQNDKKKTYLFKSVHVVTYVLSDILKELQYHIRLNSILRQHQIWLYKSEVIICRGKRIRVLTLKFRTVNLSCCGLAHK